MATVSWASLRWRGECISTSVPSVSALHLNLCANKIYSQQSLSLPFAHRLLPVHENFLLKFEVSFVYTDRCGRFRLKPRSREVENSDCVVHCYWIHYARIIGHQSTAWTYGHWHKCIFPLTLSPSGFRYYSLTFPLKHYRLLLRASTSH